MNIQQYLRSQPQPTGVYLNQARAATGDTRMTAEQLRQHKDREMRRRLKAGMTRPEYAAALGLKERSLTSTIKAITGMTFGELSGKAPRATNQPGTALDISDLAFFSSGGTATAADMAAESGHKRSSINKMVAEALTDGRIEEVRPGVYRSRLAILAIVRRPWVKGEAARLRAEELERMREEEAERWVAKQRSVAA